MVKILGMLEFQDCFPLLLLALIGQDEFEGGHNPPLSDFHYK